MSLTRSADFYQVPQRYTKFYQQIYQVLHIDIQNSIWSHIHNYTYRILSDAGHYQIPYRRAEFHQVHAEMQNTIRFHVCMQNCIQSYTDMQNFIRSHTGMLNFTVLHRNAGHHQVSYRCAEFNGNLYADFY